MERPSLRKLSRKSKEQWDGRREVDGHRVTREDESPDWMVRRGYYGTTADDAVDALLDKSPLLEVKAKATTLRPTWYLEYFATSLSCKPQARGAVTELIIGQRTVSDDQGMPIEFPGGTYRITKDADFHRLCAIVDEVLGHVSLVPTSGEMLPKEACKEQHFYRLPTNEVSDRLAAADPLIDVYAVPPGLIKYWTQSERESGAADRTHTLWRFDGVVSLYQVGREKSMTRAEFVLNQIIDADPRWYVQLLNIADRALGEYEFAP